MSTNPNENIVVKATEIKPASESGLMKKTKSELVQIILRRDSEFVEDKNTIKYLNANISDLKKERDVTLKQAGEAKLEVTKRDNIIKNKQQEIDGLNDKINNLNNDMEDIIKYSNDIEGKYNKYKVFNIILGAILGVALGIIISFI